MAVEPQELAAFAIAAERPCPSFPFSPAGGFFMSRQEKSKATATLVYANLLMALRASPPTPAPVWDAVCCLKGGISCCGVHHVSMWLYLL